MQQWAESQTAKLDSYRVKNLIQSLIPRLPRLIYPFLDHATKPIQNQESDMSEGPGFESG